MNELIKELDIKTPSIKQKKHLLKKIVFHPLLLFISWALMYRSIGCKNGAGIEMRIPLLLPGILVLNNIFNHYGIYTLKIFQNFQLKIELYSKKIAQTIIFSLTLSALCYLIYKSTLI